MTSSSTLDPDNFPSSDKRSSRSMQPAPSLGPSDSSDSGSDLPDAYFDGVFEQDRRGDLPRDVDL